MDGWITDKMDVWKVGWIDARMGKLMDGWVS